MAINYTLAIQGLTKAIGSGAKSVTFDGRTYEMRDFDDLLKSLYFLEGQQAKAEGTPLNRPGYKLTAVSRGDS